MALPIKPKDTQDSCHPISSNCVIWQGPDIPCLNLCNGDSISDVTAKLAERLCTIVNQLDISLLDLSCFNSSCPTADDFQSLIQILVNKVCSLENPDPDTGNNKSASTCPDDCIVTIAPCFQEQDFLGNLITTLSLKDYVIKVGNELCTIITIVNGNTTAISELDARVTEIENNCCDDTPPTITITTNGCVGNNTSKPIQTFVTQLETAFCNLQSITAGTNLADAQTLLSNLCINGTEDQLNQLPASVPLSSIPGWFGSVNNISQALNNLYLAYCDLRTYAQTRITQLETDLAACCAVTCDDFTFNFSGTGVRGNKFIDLYFTGSIPAGFSYCGGAAGVTISVTNFDTVPSTTNFALQDVITAITTGSTISLDLSGTPATEHGIAYSVYISLCITDGTLTCTKERTVTVYNTNWCTTRAFSLSSTNITPGIDGNITISYPNLATVTVTTTFSAQLYTAAGVATGAPVLLAGTSYTWAGPFPTGDTYYVIVTSTQTTQSTTCTTSTIAIA